MIGYSALTPAALLHEADAIVGDMAELNDVVRALRLR